MTLRSAGRVSGRMVVCVVFVMLSSIDERPTHVIGAFPHPAPEE